MLGHGKLNFETPNVIDLGDSAPSRPGRQDDGDGPVAPNSFSPPSGRYSDTDDLLERRKPSLSRTIKLNYHMEEDSEPGVPEPFHDDLNPSADDPECGGVDTEISLRSSTSQNSIEHARLIANSILEDMDRNYPTPEFSAPAKSSSAPMQWPSRRGRSDQFRGLHHPVNHYGDADDLRERDGLFKKNISFDVSQYQRPCMRFLKLVVILCVGLALTVIIIHGVEEGAKKISASSSSTSQSARLSAAIEFLIETSITAEDTLNNKSSPQYKAAAWMANQDSEQMEIPEIDEQSTRFVQRYSLATLYYGLNGPNWEDSLNFVTDAHECSWFNSVEDEYGEEYAIGAACNANLHVRSLLIPSNNLAGSMPSELRHLTALDFLSLKHNSIAGTFPIEVASLIALEYLDLKDNAFTGTIPMFLGNLRHMEVLGLSQNFFNGTVPTSLSQLPLKTLGMDDNTLTGDLSTLSTITTLEYLYGENNDFKHKLDETFFEGLSNLRELDLSGNSMESVSLPVAMFNHASLRILDLHDNLLGGSIPADISTNNVLEFLSLRENHVYASIPARIDSLVALTHLDLENNAITGTLPAANLATLSDLSYLYLGENPINEGTIPDELQDLRNIRELSLNALQFTGDIPDWVENLSELRLLDLRNNGLHGNVTIDFSNLNNLRFLMLNSNRLTGSIPQGLDALSELMVLSLHRNFFLGDASDVCQDANLEIVTTDCDVTCPCCKECCGSEGCFTDVLWDRLENSEGETESNFERSDYSFNPEILYED